jgi:cysteine desulfurase/selenocysteine lyase
VYCDHYTFASGPDKFEGGSPHTAGIISWGAAIDYLNAYGWINIHQHDISLKKYINQEFSKLKNVELLNYHCEYPIAIFNVKGINAHDVANYLGHKKIIVRSGLSCAKLTTRIINQPSVVRASFYLYNDKSDVDKLITVLKNIKKGDVIEYVI